jgi:hypothetical protein
MKVKVKHKTKMIIKIKLPCGLDQEDWPACGHGKQCYHGQHCQAALNFAEKHGISILKLCGTNRMYAASKFVFYANQAPPPY